MASDKPTIGPLPRYDILVADGRLTSDPDQRRIVRALQDLHDEIITKRLARKTSSLGWLFAKKKRNDEVRGLYIWGGVGRGKSMLMDIFHETLPVQRKRRVHFHEFMSEIHERIHQWRQDLKAGKVKGEDPTIPISEEIARESWVINFDEFQVTDIADAMILGRLFEKLFAKGVIVVATSNVEPDNLYKHGLNRNLFLPFIAMVKDRMIVKPLDSETDYRMTKLSGAPTFLDPLTDSTADAFHALWLNVTGGVDGHSETVENKGRTIDVPFAGLGAARFTFTDLCEKPLGASDYLKIAQKYHTVFLDEIPKMEAAQRNEARRFVWLIDALYDNGVKLVARADGPPASLYPAGDTAFEFERTVSRLIEMQSTDYLALPHLNRSIANSAEEAREDATALT